MKHIKTYKVFEPIKLTEVEIDNIKDIFYDLSDGGFKIDFFPNNKQTIFDFSLISDDVINSSDIKNDKLLKLTDGVLNITIRLENNFYFYIDDILYTLNFAESYIKDKTGYKLSSVYVASPKNEKYKSLDDYTYYRSLEFLPKDKIINRLSIYFTK